MITEGNIREIYDITGLTPLAGGYEFTFPYTSAQDVRVYTTGNRIDTEVSTSNYTIDKSGATPKVVFIAGYSFPAGQTKLTIIRNVSYSQKLDLRNGDLIDADKLEGALDDITQQIQQVAEKVDRAILSSVSDTEPLSIPEASQRNNMLLGFDSEGKAIPVLTTDIEQKLAQALAAEESAITAKNAAENAQHEAESAQSAAETAQGKAETAQAAAESAEASSQTLLASIETKTEESIASINTTKTGAVGAVTTQQATSVAAVQAAQNTAESDIAGKRSSALTAIDTAKTTAVAAVNTQKETSVAAADREIVAKRDSALTDIQTARTNAVNAITTKKDQSLQEVEQLASERKAEINSLAANQKADVKQYTDSVVASAKTEIDTEKTTAVTAVQEEGDAKVAIIGSSGDAEVTRVQSVYQTDLNELKGDLTNSKKAIVELDDKKITKFYASNNGNTNLPDSDNGKPSDMKIFGKSVQDGTPSPSNPIEIQSVVNPVVRMEGKNLASINNFTNAVSYGEIIPVTLKKGVGYTCSAKTTIGTTLRLNLTDGTYQDVANELGITTKFKASLVPNMDVVSISFYNTVTVSDLQIEYGSVATEYKRYQEPSSASLPYTLNAIPVESGGNVTIDGQQYIADYVDVERKKLVRHIRYGNPFTGYNWNYNSSYNYWYCDSSNYSETKNKIKLPTSDDDFVHSLWKDGVISSNKLFYNGSVKAEKAFGIGTIGIVYYRNISITSTSYNGCQRTFKNENFYYELPTPTETDLTDAELEAFKALETYYPVTNVFVTSDQVDGATIFNYPLNMANGWNYVMEQIGETRPIIYDTQVKTIENIIDTAILTAMMEA